MPAYYTFEKKLNKYMDLASELWYAAGGISVISKSSFNVARGLMTEPPEHIHRAFLHAMKQERHYDAAMLFEALIHMTEQSSYIDWQLSKNWRFPQNPQIANYLINATETAYDMVHFGMYPPSRVGLGGAVDAWYTLRAQRPSKILSPVDINKRTIGDMKHRLWSIVSQTAPWGARGYEVSPEMPLVKGRMKSLIDESLSRAEEAEGFVRRGNFLEAAVAFTNSVFLMNLYFSYRNSLASKLSKATSREFNEIDVHTFNLFDAHYHAIKDMIGMA